MKHSDGVRKRSCGNIAKNKEIFLVLVLKLVFILSSRFRLSLRGQVKSTAEAHLNLNILIDPLALLTHSILRTIGHLQVLELV